MAAFTYVLILALFVLHQDCWLWDSRSLVFGFMPVGLAYHALFSLAAAGVWAVATRSVWPHRWEEWGEEETGEAEERESGSEGGHGESGFR